MKLKLRATKLILVDYFSQKSYKLLKCTTEMVYSAQNIIFEEERTNHTKDIDIKYTE